MGSQAQGTQRRTPVPGALGFVAAIALNVVAAAVLWFALTAKYGFTGYGSIAFYYDQWLWPTAIFLAITVTAGLACLVVVPGWRWFGAGLVAGAVVIGVLVLAWSLVYLTLIEGS